MSLTPCFATALRALERMAVCRQARRIVDIDWKVIHRFYGFLDLPFFLGSEKSPRF